MNSRTPFARSTKWSKRSRSGAFDLERFASCGIVGGYSKASVEDIFVGRHRGTRFEMAEAVLERSQGAGKRRSTVTVFRGLLIALDLPERVEGRILIGRDRGRIGNRISGWLTGFKGLTRVELPHREFESRFAVYADDPGEAERVLNADFRPLSYFPLSLWPWQEAVKAVFLDRVNIISEYDQVVHSPSFEMRLPSVISLKELTRKPISSDTGGVGRRVAKSPRATARVPCISCWMGTTRRRAAWRPSATTSAATRCPEAAASAGRGGSARSAASRISAASTSSATPSISTRTARRLSNPA